MRECRSRPTITPKTCLWTRMASVIGPILSLDASVTVAHVGFHIVFVRINRSSPSVLGLTATFCPCIVYSKINTRLGHLSNHGSPHPSGGDACGCACIGYAVTCWIGVSCILQVRLFLVIHFSFRGTYHYTGDPTRQHSQPLQYLRRLLFRLPRCLLLPYLRPRPGVP